MALLDGPISQVALTLINLVGTPATFTKRNSSYDFSSGQEVVTPQTTMTRNVSPPDSWVERTVYGPAVRTSDFRVILPALGLDFIPQPDELHRLALGGDQYAIIEVLPISAGDSPAAYQLRLRK